mgnify:CR=1 FL=1
MAKIAAACAAETPWPLTVGVESSVSRVCGRMRPPPPPRRLRDGGIVGNCGWMDGVTIAMEWRLIYFQGNEVLMVAVG